MLYCQCCQELTLIVFRHLFFFKQKTAYEMRISDWSSDVCSSDLLSVMEGAGADYTLVCRRLSRAALGDESAVRALFGDLAGFDGWADRWRQRLQREQIGRASCRERVCQYV